MKVTVIIPCKDESVDWLQSQVNYLEQLQRASDTQWEILVVDDGSKVPLPFVRSAVFSVIRHPVNLGYGFALKTGIIHATGDYIATMDGDGQHRWKDMERLVEFIREFPECDMVIGDRRVKETSWLRYVGRKFLNISASLFAWRWIPDLNSGLRIMKQKPLVGYLPILCNHFSFTTSLSLSLLADNYRVDWLPVRVLPRPNGESHVRIWKDGWVTLKYIVWIGLALRTRRLRGWLRPLWWWRKPAPSR